MIASLTDLTIWIREQGIKVPDGDITEAILQMKSALSTKDAEIANLRRVLGVAKGALLLESERTGPDCYTETNEALTEIEKAGV